MTYFIDSHTHITNEELDMKLYLDEIKEAKENGVGKAMLVFTNEKELSVIESIKDDTFFDMAYGIYPSDYIFTYFSIMVYRFKIKVKMYRFL